MIAMIQASETYVNLLCISTIAMFAVYIAGKGCITLCGILNRISELEENYYEVLGGEYANRKRTEIRIDGAIGDDWSPCDESGSKLTKKS